MSQIVHFCWLGLCSKSKSIYMLEDKPLAMCIGWACPCHHPISDSIHHSALKTGNWPKHQTSKMCCWSCILRTWLRMCWSVCTQRSAFFEMTTRTLLVDVTRKHAHTHSIHNQQQVRQPNVTYNARCDWLKMISCRKIWQVTSSRTAERKCLKMVGWVVFTRSDGSRGLVIHAFLIRLTS